MDIEELREYYSDFFQDGHFVKTQITATKIVEVLNERYTVSAFGYFKANKCRSMLFKFNFLLRNIL